MIDRKRINLVAGLLALVPAAGVLWPPLQSVGFHPHGSWSFMCWLLTSGVNCS